MILQVFFETTSTVLQRLLYTATKLNEEYIKSTLRVLCNCLKTTSELKTVNQRLLSNYWSQASGLFKATSNISTVIQSLLRNYSNTTLTLIRLG